MEGKSFGKRGACATSDKAGESECFKGWIRGWFETELLFAARIIAAYRDDPFLRGPTERPHLPGRR